MQEGTVRVCYISDLENTGACAFQVRSGQKILEGFVVRWQSEYYGYLNQCPHTLAPLNWMPDQFFDVEEQFLQCSMHGALFRPEDGYCVRGPCSGQSLQPLKIIRQADELSVVLE